MTRIGYRGLSTALSLLVAGTVVAGAKLDSPVNIDTVNRGATGSVATARNSTDTVQYIGCVYHAFGLPEAQCAARNSAGVMRSCVTSDPGHLAAIAMIGSDSVINFTWDASGVCTGIHIVADSRFATKR